jgi:hypothetical protein
LQSYIRHLKWELQIADTHFEQSDLIDQRAHAGAAGFHDDKTDAAVVETALELGSGKSGGSDHFPVRIGVGELKDVLCQINGDGCSIHLGLLLVALTLTPHDASWHDDAERSGESIPSLERTRER